VQLDETMNPRPEPVRRRRLSRGFTLIELILVMTILVIAISFVAPSLSNFFRGRALNSEAVRLLSLTHAGQSRAASEGMPMLLWVDPATRAYGLVQESSSPNGGNVDPKAQEFALDDNVAIETPNATPVLVAGRRLPAIRFLPDGTIDEASPPVLRLACTDGSQTWVAQSANHLTYEIQDTGR
jgi:type II secretion system protein H